MKLDALLDEVEHAPTLRRGNYNYRLFAFGEYGTDLGFDIICEIQAGTASLAAPFVARFDYVCAIAPGGTPWGVLLAAQLQKDVVILHRGLTPDSECNPQFKPPSESSKDYFIPRSLWGKKVLLIDDVVSTGDTSITILESLHDAKIEVQAFLCIAAKAPAIARLTKRFSFPIKCLCIGE